MPIRTILFDLGNVLLGFSHEKMCHQVADLFEVNVSDVKQFLFDEGLTIRFERGELSEREAHKLLEQKFGKRRKLSDLRIALGDIFTSRPEMHELVKSLKNSGLRLVLLSNTCESHIKWIRSRYNILEEFDDLVLSYEVGACKPEHAIFEAALKTIGCSPGDCFYTDDIAEYVSVARALGVNAEVFLDHEELCERMRLYGLKI